MAETVELPEILKGAVYLLDFAEGTAPVDQLSGTQAAIYEDAEEEFQEILQLWKGSDDQKVLPHKSPEERRVLIEATEQVLKGIKLLKEPD